MNALVAQAPDTELRLDVLQPAAVRSPLDRFRCMPYSCVLTAKSCVERQKIAATPRTSAGWAHSGAGRIGDYACCRECDVGVAIRKAVAS